MGIPNLVIGACMVLLIINGLVNRRWLGLLITLAVNAAAWIGIFLTMPTSVLIAPATGTLFLTMCLLFNLFWGWHLTSRKGGIDPANFGGPGPFR